MKSLLTILAAIALGSTVLTPNLVFNNISQYNDRQVNLQVAFINGEKSYYCVPTSIQQVLNYFQVDLTSYSQDTIYHDLGGTDETRGVPMTANLGVYLNNAIPEGVFGRDYADNIIIQRFGETLGEMSLFQYYVLNSLFKGHPIIMRYTYYQENQWLGHAILITGIITNADPQFTVYSAIDLNSDAPDRRITFAGSQLLDYFEPSNGVITGYGANSDFDRNDIFVAIDDWSVDRGDLSDYENEEVIRLHQDLTVQAGINTTGQLHDKFKEISLDKAKTEIDLLSDTKEYQGFSIPLNQVPNNNDHWTSEIMPIYQANEHLGTYYREGKVSAQLSFLRSEILNHLLLTIIIYVAGSYNSGGGPGVAQFGHVIVQTGTIFSFVNKH